MQKFLSSDVSGRQVAPLRPDPLSAGTRAAFAKAADEQMNASIESGGPPSREANDLAKTEARDLALEQIAALVDLYQTSSAPAIEAVLAARIDAEPMASAQRDGHAAIAREKADGVRSCTAAQRRRLGAQARCGWYEAMHVANPAWASHYDKLDRRIRIVVAIEALIGAGILVSSGATGAGLETAVPAYALGTYVNWKWSGYLGRISFRLRRSSLGTRIKLAVTAGAVGGTLAVQNAALGLLRGGFELSLPAVLKAFKDPMSLAPALNMPALTLTGIGMALVVYISVESFQKLNRGFTDEYRRLRLEKEESSRVLDEVYNTSVYAVDAVHVRATTAVESALEDEAEILAEAKETARRLNIGKRRLCRSIVAIARSIEQLLNSYNRRVVATWSPRGEVPDHYVVPSRLDREEIRRQLPEGGDAQTVLAHLESLSNRLEEIYAERSAVNAALAKARDCAIEALRAAAYGSSTPVTK